MTKRAVLYARVSGNDLQRTGGENLQDQLKLCREYAQERKYIIVAELAEDDQGASGASWDLPQLSKVLEMARAKQYDVLIVREIDRLARNLAKQLVIEETLKSAGVGIEYVLYDFPDSPEGQLNKHLRAMLAEYERAKIEQRMTRGKLRKLRDGNVLMFGKRPYGYEIVDRDGKRTLEIVPEEAKIIEKIFTWYARGDGGSDTIARQLEKINAPTMADIEDAKGSGYVHTKRRPPRKWSGASIYKIITNETYAGTFRYGKEGIPVEVPAIIGRDLWNAAQKQRLANKANSKRNIRHDYLLRRRVTCGECGHKMHAFHRRWETRHYFYYRCPARRKGAYVVTCSNGLNYRADYVDKTAWNWIKETLEDEDRLRTSLEQFCQRQDELTEPKREQLEVIDKLIRSNESQLQRVLDLYLKEEFGKDILAAKRQQLETELTKLRYERDALRTDIEAIEINDAQITSLLEFAAEIRQGLDVAESDFAKRRQIVDILDVQAELFTEDDTKYVRLTCILDGVLLTVANHSKADTAPTTAYCAPAQTPCRYSRPNSACKSRFGRRLVLVKQHPPV